ncbi:hypothetical protein ACFLU6_04630 [Acidobacteriota bacterium]
MWWKESHKDVHVFSCLSVLTALLAVVALSPPPTLFARSCEGLITNEGDAFNVVWPEINDRGPVSCVLNKQVQVCILSRFNNNLVDVYLIDPYISIYSGPVYAMIPVCLNLPPDAEISSTASGSVARNVVRVIKQTPNDGCPITVQVWAIPLTQCWPAGQPYYEGYGLDAVYTPSPDLPAGRLGNDYQVVTYPTSLAWGPHKSQIVAIATVGGTQINVSGGPFGTPGVTSPPLAAGEAYYVFEESGLELWKNFIAAAAQEDESPEPSVIAAWLREQGWDNFDNVPSELRGSMKQQIPDLIDQYKAALGGKSFVVSVKFRRESVETLYRFASRIMDDERLWTDVDADTYRAVYDAFNSIGDALAGAQNNPEYTP